MIIEWIIRKVITQKKRFQCSRNPVKYARSLGVKVGEGTRFYGAAPETFSTEPWVITLGRNCKIAPEVLFVTHDGGTLTLEEDPGRFVIVGDIVLGDNVYVGTRSILLPGVRIGENTIIGAGSVVTKDIPANCVAVGTPCKVIKSREAYIEKVKSIMNGENQRYYSDLDYLHSLDPRAPHHFEEKKLAAD